tara:strand:+ start:2817 stop:3128 length:312 start_codon:yes stop_codon:yes gene_type:complete
MTNEPTFLAVRLHSDDTVAVVVQSIRTGSEVTITGPGSALSVIAGEDIPCYHKLSLRPTQPGEPVVRNGIVIGNATQAIKAGDWVHTHNLVSLRARQTHDAAV